LVNYDLPLDVKKLYRCQAIGVVVEKIRAGSPVTIEELKLLTYTFTFFGDRGEKELQEIIGPLNEITKKDVKQRRDLLISKQHLPVSCTKVKNEWELCSGFDCQESITPIMYCCGDDPNIKSVQKTHLADLDAKFLNKYVKTDVYISGIGDSFTVPYLMEVKCAPGPTTDFCEKCSYASGKRITINDLRNELDEPYLILEFVKISKEREHQLIDRYVKQLFKKASQCPLSQYDKVPRIEVTVVKEKTVTPLITMPAVDEVTIQDVEARESLRKRVYLTGVKKYISRKGLLIGPVLKHPRNGLLTILGICFEPTDIDLSEFKTRPEHREPFKLFQEKSIEELVEVVGEYICRIYGRPDAVEANLIAYHTPLHIIWKGEHIPGWVQITNFGDTTVGKSQIPRAIKQFVDLGFYIIVETSGRTGLLYFIDESREGHILGFGEFVLADRTLVIIDGADRMCPEERAEFRESYRQGFLKVRRVVSGTAPMRVRVIACENVKKPLSEYLYPCASLTENYEAPDIARLDLAVPYRVEDVSAETIFKTQKDGPEWLNQLREALKLNITLAWSRRPEQVIFEKDAEEEILNKAKKFDRKYGDSKIPLVSKDFDKKLAKLSAGHAALSHSYDEKGNLMVKKVHVVNVSSLIDRLYSGEGMRLDQYVKVGRERSILTSEEFREIKQTLDDMIAKESSESTEPGRPTLPITSTIVRELQTRGTASQSELQAAIAEDISVPVSPSAIRERIQLFKKYRLVISTKDGYTLTPKGIGFMRQQSRQEKDKEEKQSTPRKLVQNGPPMIFPN